MYQIIVLGLGFLLLFGGSYLIKRMDTNGVVGSTLITQEIASSTQSVSNSIQGTYICDVDSKCPNPRTLNISNNGEFRMTTSFDNGVEVLEEIGTWLIGKNGDIQFLITGTNTDIYESPVSLFVQQVSPMTLVGEFSSTHKDWNNSIFRKQQIIEE